MKPAINRFITAALAFFLAACASAPRQSTASWWKGNLHTHSLWSDGTDFPEMIADWYREHGYNFLGITEHDMLQEGDERWVDINAKDEGWPPRNQSARNALPAYKRRFGSWVQQRAEGDRDLVRLRALSEYRDKFEEPNRFLLIMGEEITDKQGAHMNAFNLAEAIQPQGGANNAERTRNNLEAVAAQRRETNRQIVAIVNHPNYVWALKPGDLAPINEARLFEVYNGHKLVHNDGDSVHLSTDQLWDAILVQRHQAGGPPIFGVANDDAHDYGSSSDTISRPGRGWIMVRAQHLSKEAIMSALAAGDFYPSTGVTLRALQKDGKGVRLQIAVEPGATYRTTFIGTRLGSTRIGEILAEANGPEASYTFAGDEIYVRAKVVSSQPQLDPIGGQVLGKKTAWTQPVYRQGFN